MGDLGYDPIVILLTKPVLDEIGKYKKADLAYKPLIHAVDIRRVVKGAV